MVRLIIVFSSLPCLTGYPESFSTTTWLFSIFSSVLFSSKLFCFQCALFCEFSIRNYNRLWLHLSLPVIISVMLLSFSFSTILISCSSIAQLHKKSCILSYHGIRIIMVSECVQFESCCYTGMHMVRTWKI